MSIFVWRLTRRGVDSAAKNSKVEKDGEHMTAGPWKVVVQLEGSCKLVKFSWYSMVGQ